MTGNVVIVQPEEDIKVDHETEKIIDLISIGISKFFSTLGFSGVLGFSAGYAIKQIIKGASFYLGCGFMFFQTLSYFGYIRVNWTKIKDDVVKLLDTDGSGKVGTKDIRYYTKKMFNLLSVGGAGATGLSAGVYMGLTKF